MGVRVATEIYSSLIVFCWILASHSNSLTIAFRPYTFPAHNTAAASMMPMSMPMSSMAYASTSMTAAATTEGCGSDHPMVYSYESPFFPITSDGKRIPSSLIILNTSIKCKNNDGKLSGVLGMLWEASSYRICADGGANRLYDATVTIQGKDDHATRYLPDLITGDLDSLRPDVRQYYETKGVSIICVEDQNFHDLDKSLMAVEKWAAEASLYEDDIQKDTAKKFRSFIYGGFGGRFDQEMGCINALCVWGAKEAFQQTTLAIYDEETCAFALPALPMKSTIRVRFPGESIKNEKVPRHGVGEGPTCGLIPIMGRCEKVRTSGLKWNLEGDTPIEFGGLVSSSNRVIDDLVTVESSSQMLFTAEMIVKQE